MNNNFAHAPSWVSFIGLILVLLGIYGSVRTAVNMAVFPKYPTAGVYYFNLLGSYAYTPPPDPNKEISAENKEKQVQACLAGIQGDRQQAKVNDISQSLLLLFLGVGTLLARKRLFAQ